MRKTTLLLWIFAFSAFTTFAQTQEEIEQMVNGSTTTVEDSTKTEKEKKKRKKDKTVEEITTEIENTTEAVETKVEDAIETTTTTTEEIIETTTPSTPGLPNFTVSEELASWKYKKLKKEGDTNFENGNFFTAIDYYQAATTKTKKKKKLMYVNMQLGESFYTLRDYESAQGYFYAVSSVDKKSKYATAEYQLANTYKYQANYDTAKTIYRAFLSNQENNSKVDVERGRARLEIKGCNFGDTMTIDFENYTVVNAGNQINGPYADFGSALYNDRQLVYSKISGDKAAAETEGMTDANFSKLTDQNGNSFSTTLNQGDIYVGNPSFTADGNTVYFTKCEMSNGTETRCDIYRSNKSGSDWSEPIKLDGVNEEGVSTTQPFITTDMEGNEVLYFVSERERGRGGKDIWFSTISEEGTFDRPKNLGYPLNTRYDEVSPFYHATSNTMYFSSNGHVSLGGFDVFKSTQDEDGDWQEAQNLKTAVNSSLDDYDFVLTSNGKSGYLVSNRVGTTTTRSATCCDDIWMVEKTKVPVTVIGKVFAENADTREEAIDTKVSIVDKDLVEVVGETTFTGEPFSFEIESDKNYMLIAEHPFFEAVELEFNTNGITRPETVQYDLKLIQRNIIEMVVGRIYYDYNESTLRADAPDTLKRVVAFMENYPTTILEVSSHTDAKGTDNYNEKLSKKRAEAAYNFLINEGIDAVRLEQQWYGEAQPIAPNENEDGSDNEEGRKLNRRTEFKVIGTTEDE